MSYAGAPAAASNCLPADRGTPVRDPLCADQTGFVTVMARTVPRGGLAEAAAASQSLAVTLEVGQRVSKAFWKVNGSAIDVNSERPTLEFVARGNTA